ncbi:MAG: PilZ domain-containing protein [Candidatus Hydrogenedentota bacterium]
MNYTGPERRKYFRIEHKLITYYLTSRVMGDIGEGTVTKNISGNGLLFQTDENIPVGTIIKIEIHLPDQRPPIVTQARVVWVEELEEKKYDWGICFTDISREDQQRIIEYINKNL